MTRRGYEEKYDDQRKAASKIKNTRVSPLMLITHTHWEKKRTKETKNRLLGIRLIVTKVLIEHLPALLGKQVDDGVVEGIDDEAVGCSQVSSLSLLNFFSFLSPKHIRI